MVDLVLGQVSVGLKWGLGRETLAQPLNGAVGVGCFV